MHSTSNRALHTESTNGLDTDEALSNSGFLESPAFQEFSDPHPKMVGGKPWRAFSPHYPSAFPEYENLELLRTQPVKKLGPPLQTHNHTKSYDVNAISTGVSYSTSQYLMQSSPLNYYPHPYLEAVEDTAPGFFIENPYMQKFQGWNGSPHVEKKGVRKRYSEREEDKIKYVIRLEEVLFKKDIRTTLMIKNIPNKYNQNMLLKTIEDCSKGQYDFFYLPIDFKVKYFNNSFI